MRGHQRDDFEVRNNYCAELWNHHTGFQLSIPVRAGRMLLGTLRHIYVFEHRRAPSTRELVLHFVGE
ncbi:MAG: YjbQ family protein, partial [Alphaproteobacteria bacterium]